jgi:hypothetical protein
MPRTEKSGRTILVHVRDIQRNMMQETGFVDMFHRDIGIPLGTWSKGKR